MHTPHGYLVQHSAGSGKSNTIAWLTHQLVELKGSTDTTRPLFDSVVVITDRCALDTAIARTIKGFDHVSSIFGHSDSAEELRGYLGQGKKIIVTTVQKFPWVLDELGGMANKHFALLIDEAHSVDGMEAEAHHLHPDKEEKLSAFLAARTRCKARWPGPRGRVARRGGAGVSRLLSSKPPHALTGRY